MAEPITFIRKQIPSEEEIQEQKLEELKTLLTSNEESLNRIMSIVNELNGMGVLEAAEKAIQAKEDIAKIALGQITRKPVTNLLNTLMGATGALMEADPENTARLVKGAVAGMDAGSEFLETNQKIRIRELMKVLNDPDINRTIGFGIHFLKGMGKELNN